jgi:hypothetical protein
VVGVVVVKLVGGIEVEMVRRGDVIAVHCGMSRRGRKGGERRERSVRGGSRRGSGMVGSGRGGRGGKKRSRRRGGGRGSC